MSNTTTMTDNPYIIVKSTMTINELELNIFLTCS